MKRMHRQAGMTLIETMIALAMSLIVTTSMIGLMGNSMGAATRIIEMSQLTDELRNVMSLLSRDVRRANFNANNIYCYSNSDCGVDGSAPQADDLLISTTGDNTCIIFGLDRNWDGDADNDGGAAFRRATDSGVGLIEMWVGSATPACGATSTDWVAVTDPDFVNVTGFTVSNADSFEESLTAGSGTLITQRTRYVEIQIDGQLILDTSITRTVKDKVKVRNNLFL